MSALGLAPSMVTAPKREISTTHRTQSILDFVAKFTSDLNALYRDPYAVQIILSSMPPLARQYIMRMVALGNLTVPARVVESWFAKSDQSQAVKDDGTKQSVLASPEEKGSRGGERPPPSEHDAALARMSALRVLIRSRVISEVTKEPEIHLQLHPSFQSSLFGIMTGISPDKGHLNQNQVDNGSSPATTTSASSPSSTDDRSKPLDPSALDSVAADRWARMLHFMGGVCELQAHPSDAVAERLVALGLMMRKAGESQNEEIAARLSALFTRCGRYIPTAAGVRFLLMTTEEQVWQLVKLLLQEAKTRGRAIDESLRFLLRLSFMKTGVSYWVPELTESQRTLLLDLSLLGITYQSSPSSKRYYTTFLIQGLVSSSISPARAPPRSNTSSSPPLQNNNVKDASQVAMSTTSLPLDKIVYTYEDVRPSQGFVLIEGSLKIYAYTQSPLMISILSLFTRLDFRLPNMVAGLITRESISRISLNDVKDTDIVAWLTRYAHPRMIAFSQGLVNPLGGIDPVAPFGSVGPETGPGGAAKIKVTGAIVPLNVAEQIKQWQEERHRLSAEDACQIKDFESLEEYRMWAAFARTHGDRLYENESKRMLIVTLAGLERIKAERDRQRGIVRHQSPQT